MEPQRVGRYLDKLKLANKLKAKFGDLNFNITTKRGVTTFQVPDGKKLSEVRFVKLCKAAKADIPGKAEIGECQKSS